MATRQNVDYGYEIQKVYLEMMMRNGEVFARCQSVFDPLHFDRQLKPAAEFIQNYVNEHVTMPTFDMVNAATHVSLKDPGELQDNHFDWLLLEFETFSRHKALEAAILKGGDLLEKGDYGPVEDLVRAAVQIGLQRDLGIDYWENPKERLMRIKEQNKQIPTGWKHIDQMLYGGFSKGELEIFCGGSGSGKSVFLANLGVNYSLEGFNVVYLTFELSEELVGMRLDSMISEVPNKEIFRNLDDVDLKVRMVGKKSGRLQVKYMASGKTPNDTRAYLKELEVKTKRKVDVVIVDYMDLMMPAGKKISAENLFIKDKYVSEELRNMAMELDAIVVTAAQLNRCLVLDTKVIANGKEIEIQDVKVGDRLETHSDETVKVTEVMPVTRQPVYRVKTASGKTITCSAKHLFPTESGVKNIEQGLQVGDRLYIRSMDN